MPALSELLGAARRRLAQAGLDTPELDARLLVEHFTQTSRADAVADPGRAVPADAAAALEAALARRLDGEPVHRILGYREFYGLRLALSPGTLEPRPDTETLVDAMLPFVKSRALAAGGCRILDLGTGTGAIALALLSQAGAATATGVDLSADALTTARGNAEANGLGGRFQTLESDWFETVTGRYDAIVSNPPYIEREAIEALAREVRSFDPVLALDGGADGLDAYRAIAGDAHAHLDADGRIGLEIGNRQKAAVTAVFERSGWRLVEARQDLAGHDRVLVFAAQPGFS